MTKKQIMINGVYIEECENLIFLGMDEVSCCKLHKPEMENNVMKKGVYCSDNPNCYYKQLKRKEQECKELKEYKASKQASYETMQREWNEAKNEVKQLKADNEELKKTVDDLLHKPEIQDKILWKVDNEALLGSKDAWIYKLKQALQEIKEIAKNAEEQCAIPENYFKRNNVSWKQHQLRGLTCKFKQILQKCEVIDD